MRKKVMLLTAFVSLAAIAAADGGSTTAPIPASPQDIINAEGRLERSIEKAAKESRQGRDAARRAEKREHDGITDAIGSVAKGQKGIGNDITTQGNETRAASAAEEEKTRETIRSVGWLIGATSCGLIMIVGALIAWRIRKGRNARDAAVMNTLVITPLEMAQHAPAKIIQLGDNPRPNQIRDMFKSHSGIKSLNIFYAANGSRTPATILKSPEDILSVNFPEFPDVTPCGLDKAYKTAMFLLSKEHEFVTGTN